MKKHVVTAGLALTFVTAAALVCGLSGCGDRTEGPSASAGASGPALCAGCGQIKGGDACCKADATKCDKCGLAEDSPGCCKISKELIAKGEPIPLCTKCGQIKGTDVCCKAGAAKCDKCGLAEGSPGCCKLPK